MSKFLMFHLCNPNEIRGQPARRAYGMAFFFPRERQEGLIFFNAGVSMATYVLLLLLCLRHACLKKHRDL